MYPKEFKELVERGLQDNFYVGTGNPNAKILLVGKEAAKGADYRLEKGAFVDNAKTWKKHFEENTTPSYSFMPEINILRKSGNPWRAYQTLQSIIYDNPIDYKDRENCMKIDFLENIFTTEMSDVTEVKKLLKQEQFALKLRLDKRINTFLNTDFIKQFPIVLLVCGKYISNEPEHHIENIFNVKFFTTESKYPPFDTYYNENRTKLVIHSPQLSGAVYNHVLERMGEIIRKFMLKNEMIS